MGERINQRERNWRAHGKRENATERDRERERDRGRYRRIVGVNQFNIKGEP
jgi:hypothetical protein